MKITIATTALATIVDHAAAALPAEACGIAVGSGDMICAAIPARNVAAAPATAFEIDPQALFDVQRAARRDGTSVVGWYHSHPDGAAEPSAIDAARAAGDGKLWLIAAGGAVSAWRAGTHGLHGRFSPVALVAR